MLMFLLMKSTCPSITPKNLRRLLIFTIKESLLILFRRLIQFQEFESVGPRLTLKLPISSVSSVTTRSEERRVGKEYSYQWWPFQWRKKSKFYTSRRKR